jgi:very-short-patch-repair endonuclease
MIQPKILISQADIDNVIISIYKTIIQGMDLAANVIATEVQLAARRYLAEGIAAYGAPKKPGRGTSGLRQGIMVKEFKSGGAEYSRYDVFVDIKRFPYTCVYGGKTKVVTKDGYKAICSIKVGDKVLTQDGKFHTVVNTNKFKAIKKPSLVTITTEYRNGSTHKLTVTDDHKILVLNNGCSYWKPAGELNCDDILLSPKKLSVNKGKFYADRKNIVCKWCKKEFEVYKSYLKHYNVSFCSNACKYAFCGSDKNYHIGMKRSNKTRKLLSALKTEYYKNNPKQHLNYKLSKSGYKTAPEKEIEKYLIDNNIRYKYNYNICKYWVDFYCPDLKLIFEADGGYWHKDQQKDLLRDKELLKYLPKGFRIIHLHFIIKEHAINLETNPLPNVYYLQTNPSMSSYVNLERFKFIKILNIKKWKVTNKNALVYDLSVEGMHSFVANGILISNCWVEYGRNAGSARPYANKGGKDYSKSKFSGHLFLTKALEEFSSEKSRDIARECILGSLFTKKRI